MLKKLSLLALGFLCLTGCSKYSSHGESLYLKERNGPKIEVPAPLSSANISSFYDLPEQNQKAKVSIAPPVDSTPVEQ